MWNQSKFIQAKSLFPPLPEYIIQLSCSSVAKVSSAGFDLKKSCYFPGLFTILQVD